MSGQSSASPPHFICITSQPMRLSSVLQGGQTLCCGSSGDYMKLPTIGTEGEVGGTAMEKADGARQHELMSCRSPCRTMNLMYGREMACHGKPDADSTDGHLLQDDCDDVGDYPTGIELGSVGEATFQLLSQEEVEEQGLQSVAISNEDINDGPTVVQYAHGPDGQIYIPVHQLGSSSVMSFPRGVVVGNAGGVGLSPSTLTAANVQLITGDELVRKRELRLMKNKEAAKECRRKKKEYVRCLENRVAVLENQNRTLIEELKSLKELYCQKESRS